jgi:hypothetical protein
VWEHFYKQFAPHGAKARAVRRTSLRAVLRSQRARGSASSRGPSKRSGILGDCKIAGTAIRPIGFSPHDFYRYPHNANRCP